MTEEERMERLLQGLVGEGWRRLYEMNAMFHASVSQLALMLPDWVAGLAAHAEKEQGTIVQEWFAQVDRFR